MSKRIGFVGLGIMGPPMVINLNKASFEVIGYDTFGGSRERVKTAGITAVATLKEAAEQTDDATVSMIRGYNQNVGIPLGEDGLLSADPKGLTIIVMSTLDPDSASALGQQVEAAVNVKLIAAAANGDATGTQAGMLLIMVSGPEDRVNAARPYFDAVGSNTSYYGANLGNSQAAKLVSNMVLGIIMNGVAESLKFGGYYNLPQEALLNLLKASIGDSRVARNWDSAPKWIEDTAPAALLKDPKVAHLKGPEHDITMPFNTLSSTMLFDS